MKVGAPRLEDRLGSHEPPYKSRGEAQVGRLLDRYGIPFFYEQPIILRDGDVFRTFRPDFTLPRQRNMIVEYAGMPDRSDYMVRLRHKMQVYAENSVSALFVYPRDLQGGDWHPKLINQIYRFAGQTGYRPHQNPYRGRSI